MAERSWCPSLSLQSGSCPPLADNSEFPSNLKSPQVSEKASARRDAAVAANSGASAKEISETIATSFQRRFQKFDPAVVSSNANRLHWPHSSQLSDLQFSAPLVPREAAICLNVCQLQSTHIGTSLLAVLNDSIPDIISLLERRGAVEPTNFGADVLTGLVSLPSTSQFASLSDIFDSLVSSKAFLSVVQHLTVCDATAGDGPTSLADFARSAAKLKSLYLMNCMLLSDMLTLMETLKDREVQHLGLERCSIGCATADADRDAILASMAAYLKLNKFLLSLDLSYVNLDAAALSVLTNALSESDTLMLLEDQRETPDNYDPFIFSDRITADGFTTAARKDSTDGSESCGAAEEANSNAKNDNRSFIDDDGEDGDSEDADGGDGDEGSQNKGDDEEEDEGEEGAVPQRSCKAVAKEQKKRERERRMAEWEQRQKHLLKAKRVIQLEAETRCTLAGEYLSGLSDVVAISSAAIAKRYTEEKQTAKEAHCARRSGWSRVQSLVLRGNRLGDSGAKHIALILRDDVPLSEEEAKQKQDAADEKRIALCFALSSSGADIAAEEVRVRRALRQLAKAELEGLGGLHGGGADANAAEGEEEDKYAKEAPPVVLTNVDGHLESGDGDVTASPDDVNDGVLAEEKQRWEAWAAEAVPQVMVPPVKKGMRSVTLLDLGSCHIGKKGLQVLAQVLKTNKVLESLCLRHNPIGNAAVKPTGAAHVDAAATISKGFAAFVEMVCVNKTLHTLDLGYCQLGPQHMRALAAALSVNSGLQTLGLEGNRLGADDAYQQKKYPHSYLYELWMATVQPGSALLHLHMSHNSIAMCLWLEEAVVLTAACGQLLSLSVSHVGFQEVHLQRWLEAIKQSSDVPRFTVRKLQLARNEWAGETAGNVLGSLLQHFSALEELSLDEHPLLGSAGVAAAIEYLPGTMRRLSCSGTGLTEPLVGAVQAPVIPLSVSKQLTSLALCDVDASTPDMLSMWTTHVAETTPQIQYLSLWSRGMAGKENAVLPHFVKLAEACPSLVYVDCGYQPQFRATSPGAAHFVKLEKILLPRRISLPS